MEKSGIKRSTEGGAPDLTEVPREYSVEELGAKRERGEVFGTYDPIPDDIQRVRVLDIFCGRGGVGLALRELFSHRHINGAFLGVDIEDYSGTYPGRFVQMDAKEVTLEALGMEEPADLVWLSPSCKPYSRLSGQHYDDPREEFPTIPEMEVHELADRLGKESVIENVPTCGDLNDDRTVTLNGGAFGLPIHYRRTFEVSFIDQFDVVRYEDEPPDNQEVAKVATSHPEDLVRAKQLPPSEGRWTEEDARSAIPPAYVAYLLSHCPTLPEIEPPGGRSGYHLAALSGGQSSLTEF